MEGLDPKDFWSLENINGEGRATLRHGFTDGVYNFYEHDNGTWYAIDPENGCGIGSGMFLETAKADAYSSYKQELIQNSKDAGRYQKYAERFRRICEEQGVSIDDWADKISSLSDLFS